MRFSTSLFDYLFGERVTVEVQGDDGRLIRQKVTRRWLKEIGRHGKARKAEGNAIDPRNQGSPRERAQLFFSRAKTSALLVWEPFVRQHPHLWEAVSERGHSKLSHEEKCFKWDFLHLVAMTWWAVNFAELISRADEFEEFADCVKMHLSQWNAGAEAAYGDLEGFISAYESDYRAIADPGDRIRFAELVVGTWIVWNLTNKAELSNEAELASVLGHSVHMYVRAYCAT